MTGGEDDVIEYAGVALACPASPEEAAMEETACGAVVEDTVGTAKFGVGVLEGGDEAGFEAADGGGAVFVVGEAEAGVLGVEGLVPVDLLATVSLEGEGGEKGVAEEGS